MLKDEIGNNSVTPETWEADAKVAAGAALFELKPEGTWFHCGYHLTASIVSPTLLSLPSVMTRLGWEAGMLFLAAAAIITFYSYTLFSRILDHYAVNGRRLLCFRDMAHHILGNSCSTSER
ncbi:GABA transporter 1 [Platanthera zijinensis]|uniref:GABA transporter 1 n=1 Tax=Platanthera zijinensis TaxID=2320716 RepID=A0AAP0BSZ9_9ASPA